ncbi:TPA: hypothetical protein ACODIZ_003599 [Salmonella enterica subsp. enterica serovar Newport]
MFVVTLRAAGQQPVMADERRGQERQRLALHRRRTITPVLDHIRGMGDVQERQG